MPDLEAGSRLGKRFEIRGVLGRGGTATVYLARDTLREEDVALKVLSEPHALHPSTRARLRREVLAASRLRHPNALVAYELHEFDGRLALTMPVHPGRTLHDYVALHGPLDGAALYRLALQIGGALSEAHRLGIVHRDITPSNIMVDERGDAVLTDFGLAHIDDQRTMTGTGALGTCGYAAPEMFEHPRCGPISDIYGLGAVLYFAAAGRPPFDASSSMGIIQKQLEERFKPLAELRPDLPPHFAATIERMIRRDPHLRPPSLRESLRWMREGFDDAADNPDTGRSPASASTEPKARASLSMERGETHPPSASAPPDESDSSPRLDALEPVRLPPGQWTVAVRERRRDRRRRRRMRKRHRRASVSRNRAPGPLTTSALKSPPTDGLVERIGALFDMETDQAPERLLTEAVLQEAGRMEGELILPPALFHPRFRLVDEVDEATARRLAHVAQSLGFKAKAVEIQSWRNFSERVRAHFSLDEDRPFPFFIGAAVFVVFLQIPFTLIALFVALFSLHRPGRFPRSLDRWPVAYPAKLDSWLVAPTREDKAEPADRPRHARNRGKTGEAPMNEAARGEAIPQEVQKRGQGKEFNDNMTGMPAKNARSSRRPSVQAVEPPTATHTSGSDEEMGNTAAGRNAEIEAVVTTTRSKVHALRALLEKPPPSLPEAAAHDLRRSVAALEARLESLAENARRLATELDAFDEEEALRACTRIEGRLQRLRLLDAQEGVSRAEEERVLNDTLEIHQKTLRMADELDARITMHTARLLEIGATAVEIRQAIGADVRPISADDLLDRLKAEADAARLSADELARGDILPDGDSGGRTPGRASAEEKRKGVDNKKLEAASLQYNHKKL